MDDKIQVTLTGPAKIGDVWHKAGDTPMVDATIHQQLVAMGVVPAADIVLDVGPASQTSDMPQATGGTKLEFYAAVEAKAKELAAASFDGALAELEQEIKDILAAAEVQEAAKTAALADAAAKQERIETLEDELQLVKTALVDAGQSHDAALAEARKTISDQEALIARLQKAAAKTAAQTKADPPPRGT